MNEQIAENTQDIPEFLKRQGKEDKKVFVQTAEDVGAEVLAKDETVH